MAAEDSADVERRKRAVENAFVQGEIDAAQLVERVRARYRLPDQNNPS